MKKLDIGVIVTTLIIVTISCSLAFFAARVVGEPKDINLVAKNVAITFNDTSIIANGVVSPGWNTTKTFTITNNSKEEYKYNISIKDLINTFVTEGYLQYKITSTNGYNMTEFKDIPKSSAPKDTILAYSVSIPVGVTQNYTIEFKYANDESVDQSDDMGRKLSGTLFITEGTEDPSLATLIKANAVNENGYRYEGTNPNNYIYMVKNGSNELWRIIGLFPDGVNGEEVIRVRKVGYEKAKYNSNNTNHWPKVTLYTTLSSIYSLTNYKNTVNYKMYLGGADDDITSYTSQDLYDMERMLNSKGTAGKTSQDSYSSTTTFTGSVGLMYPSDYGYAVLASDCARNIQPYNYDRTSSCYINNWLFQGSSTWQWAISPNSFYANSAFHVLSSGLVFYNYGGGNFNHMISFSGSYSPVMALKSDVYVTGSGTQSDPYVMQ